MSKMHWWIGFASNMLMTGPRMATGGPQTSLPETFVLQVVYFIRVGIAIIITRDV